MPSYDYQCEANGVVLEVTHSMDRQIKNWGQLCELAGIDVGETPSDSGVSKIFLTPPMTNTPVGDSALKNLGFTKLVKRDDGVYENVTATGTEQKLVKAGQPETMPHFSKKLSD